MNIKPLFLFLLDTKSNHMNSLLIFIFFIASLPGCREVRTRPEETTLQTSQAMKSIYDIPLKTIDGQPTTLSQYKGKKMLLVNVASECGYTPQYADLQALWEQHGDKVVVLGFPANNFGGQEPGSNDQIQSFCSKNFGVTFPLFEKNSVKGNDMQELYEWLTNKDLNGWNEKAPNWNFCKYLISEDGKLLNFYSSGVNPMDAEITGLL